jgi:hypothetical protein
MIKIEHDFDYSIFSEISPWAYFRVKTVHYRIHDSEKRLTYLKTILNNKTKLHYK